MLNYFVPDQYYKSIYDIDYLKLKKNGIKCLIFDLDNTVAPLNIDKPNKKIKDLFEDLKNKGLKVVIVSNCIKKRVEPFKDILGVDSSYMSFKPLKKKYKKILRVYRFKENEIACIGDQLLTDILGANRMSFLSILVNPIGTTDFAFTKINRSIENNIYYLLEKKDLFKRGKYYD